MDISWLEVITNSQHPYYEQYKELKFNLDSCRTFNKYMFDTIQMGQALELRTYPTKAFHLKDSAKHCFDTSIIGNFPELTDWIKNLKIFSEIGRIIFFFNSPYDKHAVHKDHYFGTKEQFILINLHPGRKEFFILHDNGEKLIVDCNAVIFDPRNYHGSEGKEYYGWTLRIDGRFDIEWLHASGLWHNYNSN